MPAVSPPQKSQRPYIPRATNAEVVYNAIKAAPWATMRQIAASTGLALATVHKCTQWLISEGKIIQRNPRGGREVIS
jgi:hypothetical protein